MAKAYDNKCCHNKDFLQALMNDYPDQFFDWKVTVQFYVALHRCYCVLEVNNYGIETKHGRNIDNLKKIDAKLAMTLFLLFKNSRQSRYDGFMQDDAMERINKIHFDKGVKHLATVEAESKKYYPVPVAV